MSRLARILSGASFRLSRDFSPTLRRSACVAVVLLALGYLGLVATHCSPYAGGSDSSGYLNLARMLDRGELTTSVPRIDSLAPPAWSFHFQQPLGFLVDGSTGRMVPTYPPGFPLHLVVASWLVGLNHATILVNVVLVAAAIALMTALGRHFGLPWSWSLVATALLCASAMFLHMALQPMSDLPATVWVMAAIWFALRARTRWPWAVASGFAVAVAVLVRPTNLLVLFPVAIALGRRPGAWLGLITGGLPGALFLAAYNLELHGKVFTTGYGAVGELFRMEYFPHNVLHFALWISLLVSPPIVLAALALPALREHTRLLGLATAWSIAFVGCYVFYYHSGETWWYLRFILPMFPAIILGGVASLYHASERLAASPWARALPAAAVALAIAWDVGVSRHFALIHLGRHEVGYAQAAHWLNAEAPASAIVLQMQCSGAFTYYTVFPVVRWDLIEPQSAWPLLLETARRDRRPIYAALFDFEREPALHQRTPGNWIFQTRSGHVSIWQLAEAPAARSANE